MASKPNIMVSSSVYGFEDTLSQICALLKEMGCLISVGNLLMNFVTQQSGFQKLWLFSMESNRNKIWIMLHLKK